MNNINLGVYISSIGEYDKLRSISDAINRSIDSGKLKDASIFYDNISHNPFQIKCGLFNATDLWNFNGKLITLSLSTTLSALRIVNKIDLYYYYGFENKISPLSLLYMIKNHNLKFISTNQDQDDDLYRKTSTRSTMITNNFNDLIDNLGEI